jgi:hypothetical protein
MTRLVIDFDFVKFEAASLAEERSIIVTHKASGNQKEFATRTEFWGDWRKKEGGWLAEQNKSRLSPMLAEEFDVEDRQTPKGMAVAKQVVRSRIEGICAKAGTEDYYGYVSKGTSFREGISTVLRYKGNRSGLIRPLLLDDVSEYLIKRHNTTYQEHWEVDDRVIMDWYADKSLTVVMVDKDAMGCEVNLLNPDTMDEPMEIRGLGGLWIDGNKQVKGYGRKWLYMQCGSSDLSDNYAANSACDTKWGPKSMYQLLAPCQTDKECFEALIKAYVKLYPAPKKITGWRGDEIEIDWLYMLNENFQLARMRRWVGDEFHVQDVLTKLGINY